VRLQLDLNIVVTSRLTEFSSAFPEATMRRILLLLPFIGLLWLPFYNFREPYLWGFPFFYWYMFAWVPVASLCTYIVYRGEKS
jgi:hypothetical protein